MTLMDDWQLTYDNWDPQKEPLREALCTLGNGYFATRGALCMSKAGGVHYPGTYMAGGFNRLKSEVADKTIENEDLVNWPNWLYISFKHENEDWLDLEKLKITNYEQTLDLYKGYLKRSFEYEDDKGRRSALFTRRFVNIAEPNLAALEWKLTPLNWTGSITIRSALDGQVTNSGVERYKELNSKHLKSISAGKLPDAEGIFLLVETSQSHIRMCQAARTELCDGDYLLKDRSVTTDHGFVAEDLSIDAKEGQPIGLEKIVSVYSSRENAISEPSLEACKAIKRVGEFKDLIKTHILHWENIWKRCDIQMKGEHETQLILRLHIFHLIQSVSPNHMSVDYGVPARGLHGEAYRGHIFWDELFILPFLNFSLPERTREVLMYRFRRLAEARYAAKEEGYNGAMFPWQSGSNGREESQEIHLNPQSGRWIPDNTFLQRHINAAIAYNVWQYYQATNDIEFMTFYGAEMILEIARFWSSIAEYNPERDRYEIRNIVGPDEYHTQYPDKDEPGIHNNAYTNIMAVWVLKCAEQVLDLLEDDFQLERTSRLRIDKDEKARWKDITRKMYVPFIDEGIIAQFEGYGELKELDWDQYHREHGDNMRLDRILEKENDSPNNYQANKQADVLMLFYLLTSQEITSILEDLGYQFKPDDILKNIDYYESRTSHGSTLSKLIYSWVLARSDRQRSWQQFEQALHSDIHDVQGGTTQEGIHLGAMAGTVDLMQRCYTGMMIKDDVLWFNPLLPDHLECMELRIRFRGNWLHFKLETDCLKITFQRGWSDSVKIGLIDNIYQLNAGEFRKLDISSKL